MFWKVTESVIHDTSFKGCCNYPLYWCHTHRRSCTPIDKLTCQLATWAGVFSNPCRSRWFWMSKVLATRSMHHWPLRSGIVCHLWFDWVWRVGKDTGECKYGGLIQNNYLGDTKYQLVWFEWHMIRHCIIYLLFWKLCGHMFQSCCNQRSKPQIRWHNRQEVLQSISDHSVSGKLDISWCGI